VVVSESAAGGIAAQADAGSRAYGEACLRAARSLLAATSTLTALLLFFGIAPVLRPARGRVAS
jgi:hypothetical protein